MSGPSFHQPPGASLRFPSTIISRLAPACGFYGTTRHATGEPHAGALRLMMPPGNRTLARCG